MCSWFQSIHRVFCLCYEKDHNNSVINTGVRFSLPGGILETYKVTELNIILAQVPQYFRWSNGFCFCLVVKLCLTLRPHGLQHARLPCPPLSPRVCSNSCRLSRWYYLTIASSASPFSFCLQSFPASGSFPMSQLFTPSGKASASALVLLRNIQGWFPLGLIGLISL